MAGARSTRVVAEHLEAKGDAAGALAIYAELKLYADAGRIARNLGRNEDAARHYTEGRFFFEAASAWFAAGDRERALETLVQIKSDDPRYRSSAIGAARIASELQTFGWQLETFLAPFLASAPRDVSEADAFYAIVLLYEKHEMIEPALGTLRKIVASFPGFRDAASRLEALQSRATAAAERIMREEASFFGKPVKPSAPTPVVAAPPRGKGFPLKGAAKPPAPPPELILEMDALVPIAEPPVKKAGATLFEIPGGAPPAPTRSLVAVGSVLGERFRLEEKIGAGGMAEVYRAKDLGVDEEVALKIFSSSPDPGMAERFKQETRLARRLTHANVVRVHDIGVFDGRLCISMELLRGKDCEAVFLENRLTVAQIVDVIAQACAGLHEAHAQGVVHRDVKPENLFFTDAGVVKVMDFGLAKGATPTGHTQSGMLAGTPEYMAPEQIDDFRSVSPATDVYAMGAVAYRALCGRPPFRDDKLLNVLLMQVNDPPAPLRKYLPSIPEALERAVLKCLEKDPKSRFPDAAALRAALLEIGAGLRQPG